MNEGRTQSSPSQLQTPTTMHTVSRPRRLSRAWLYCGILCFVVLVVLLVGIVINGQPSPRHESAQGVIHHEIHVPRIDNQLDVNYNHKQHKHHHADSGFHHSSPPHSHDDSNDPDPGARSTTDENDEKHVAEDAPPPLILDTDEKK
jgi:hypothetical protein